MFVNDDEFAAYGQMAEGQARRALQFDYGEVSKYDPVKHTVRVRRKVGDQTEEIPLDLPLLTPGATKNGGVLVGLEVGAPVLLLSMGLSGRPDYAISGGFTDTWGPPPKGLRESEIWLVHRSGMGIRLTSDGQVWIGAYDARLSEDDAVVRRKDLQAVVDWINNTLLPAIRVHGHPPPGVGPPVNVASFVDVRDAQASGKTRVE